MFPTPSLRKAASVATSTLLAATGLVAVGLSQTPASAAATCPAGSDPVTTLSPGALLCEVFIDASGTWTVPQGVTSIEAIVVAGGGGGGGGGGMLYKPTGGTPALVGVLGAPNNTGGGGGGGEVVRQSFTVVAGDSMTAVVGAGGAGGTSPNALVDAYGAKAADGSDGSSSSFGFTSSGSPEMTAAGGHGGKAGDGDGAGAGGAAGGASGPAGGTGVQSLNGNPQFTAGGGGGGVGGPGQNAQALASDVRAGDGGAPYRFPDAEGSLFDRQNFGNPYTLNHWRGYQLGVGGASSESVTMTSCPISDVTLFAWSGSLRTGTGVNYGPIWSEVTQDYNVTTQYGMSNQGRGACWPVYTSAPLTGINYANSSNYTGAPALSYNVTKAVWAGQGGTGGIGNRGMGGSAGRRGVVWIRFYAPSTEITITAKSLTMTYGNTVPAAGYTVAGMDAADWFPTTPALVCKAYTSSTFTTELTQANAVPGVYTGTKCTGPTASGLGKPIVYTNGTMTINKAPLTLHASDTSKVYGETLTMSTDTQWSVTAGGLVNGDTFDTKGFTFSGSGNTSSANAGTYTITPTATLTGKTLANYYSVTNTPLGVLTVTPIGITLTANDKSAKVGDSLPGFDYSLSPLVTLDAPATCGTSVVDTSVAGNYDITCTGGSKANYSITRVKGTFSVTSSKVIVRAHDSESTYGQTPALLGFDYENLGADSISPTPSCVVFSSGSPVTLSASTRPGTYEVRCTSTATASSGGTEIEYVYGNYTVHKAKLTVTALDQTKTYGSTMDVSKWEIAVDTGVSDPSIDVTLNSDGSGATAGVQSLPYSITASAEIAGDTIADFYDITYVDGALVVLPATLTVTAKSESVVFNSDAPSYTYTSITGWQNGEAESDPVDGWTPPTCVSGYTATAPIGSSWSVTCSGGAADNYVFEFAPATVSVTNGEVGIENRTTSPVTSATDVAGVTLSALITHWSPGCLVTWTLDPSVGTNSPYTTYATADNVNMSVDLPIGVYNITVSVSGNCEGTPDSSGVLVIAPLNPGVGTVGGGWYRAAPGGPKLSFGYVLQVKSAFDKKTLNTNTTYWGQSLWTVATGWRLKAAINKTITQYANGTLSGTAPYGLYSCPTSWSGITTAPNAACGAIQGEAKLQQYVLRSGTGRWEDYTTVTYTVTVYDGGWLTVCKNKTCKTTDQADFYGIALRTTDLSKPIPTGIGQSTPQKLNNGQIQIWR